MRHQINQGQLMEKRPTDLNALFLLNVYQMMKRFIRWSFLNPLDNFLNRAVLFAELQY